MRCKVLLALSCFLALVINLPVAGQEMDRMDALERADSIYRSGNKQGAYPEYAAVAVDRKGELILDSLSGYALHKMGVCAQYTNRPVEGIRRYHQAIAVRTSVLGPPHNDIAKTQANLAALYLAGEELDSAAFYLYRANDAYELLEHPDTVNWVRSLGDLAKIADRRRAGLLLEDATARASELIAAPASPVDPYEAAILHYNFGLHFIHVKQLEKAGYFTDRALEYALATEDTWFQSSCENLFYLIDLERGETGAARKHLLKAIRLLPERGNESEVGIYYSNLATLELNDGNYSESRRAANRALELLPPEELDVTAAYGVLAQLAQLHRDTAAAFELHNKSIAALHEKGVYYAGRVARHHFADLNDMRLGTMASLLQNRAEFLHRHGKLPLALADYLEAIAANDHLRDRVSSDASRRYLSEDIRPLFDSALVVTLELYRTENDEQLLWQALLLSDAARAYTLAANATGQAAASSARETELNRLIGRLEATATSDSTLRSQLVAARLERDRIHQLTHAVVRRDTARLTRAAIVEYLRAHQTRLVQFHLLANRSIVFNVDERGHIALSEWPGAETLNQRTQEFRDLIRASAYRLKSLKDPDEQRRLEARFLAFGNDFALPLVRGFGEARSEGRDRLLLVPDGALNYFPFAALPLTTGSVIPPLRYAEMDYLGTHLTLQHAYSLSTLLAGKEAPTERGAFLAMAPTFTGALEPLAQNEREVVAITQAVTGDAVVGSAASRATFLSASPAASIVHLSTHGYSDAADPNGSWIAFSQSGPTPDPDQLLYYPEIATLPIAADLVVLSACETSLGKYAPGETSLSLASAFTAAGARSTVNTLWRVDDRATANLMIAFYEQLSKGEDRTEALRLAQQALIDEGDFAHPHYWAGVSLTGGDGPVAFAEPEVFNPKWLIGGVLLLLLPVLLLALRRANGQP